MLNEILEYKQYTYSINKDGDTSSLIQRIRKRQLVEGITKFRVNLSGFTRPMTIIARYWLFNVDGLDYSDADTQSRKEIISITKEVLKLWLGFDNKLISDNDADLYMKEDSYSDKTKKILKGNLEELKRIKGWFPHYIDCVLINENVSKLKNSWKNREQIETETNGPKIVPEDPEVSAIEDDLMEDTSQTVSDDQKVEEILNNLSGDDDPDEKLGQLFALEKLFNKYKVSSSEFGMTEKLLKIRRALKGKETVFDKPMFYFSLYDANSEENDFFKITYEKIIADALDCGRLQPYVLACSDQDWDKTVKKESSKTGRLSIADKDVITKMTAAWLIARKQNKIENDPEVKHIQVERPALNSWCAAEKQDRKLDPSNLRDYYYVEKDNEDVSKNKRMRVFSYIKVSNGSAKIYINEEWIKRCGWRLLSENDLKGNASIMYYKDHGAREYLELVNAPPKKKKRRKKGQNEQSA